MTSSGPDLTAVIAELAGRLPPGHVAAWARVLRSVTQQDAATQTKLIEARLIEAKSGFALSALTARLMAAWRAADPPQPGAAIALALETAALVHADVGGPPQRCGHQRPRQRLHSGQADQLGDQRADP